MLFFPIIVGIFHFIFPFLSFASLHPTPPTPTMTLNHSLHTLLSISLMIIFQLLSSYIFSCFILFFFPLTHFTFWWQWTGVPPQETPAHTLLSPSFVSVLNSNLSIWMHLFLCLLCLRCTLTLHVHEQKLIYSFYYDLFFWNIWRAPSLE